MKHTDAHTKHNLKRIFPNNIRQKYKTSQELYVTTHTQKNGKHVVTFNEDTQQINIRPDARNLRCCLQFARKQQKPKRKNYLASC